MTPSNAPPPPTPWHSLRHHRLQASLTLAALAQRAGLSESGVQHLESGRRRNPRPQTVARLAKALGVTVDKLRADLADNPTAVEELDELRRQAAVLSERIEQASRYLPDQRTKTAQEVA